MDKDNEKAREINEITKEIKLKNKEWETLYGQLEIMKKDAYLLQNQVLCYC